ncbi:hypothetical protein PtA15_9A241 [Puccinia triticina]|uniref:Uncharacterized protein n=1 Tax=Puccinia triticina TaxID=208348 RepID=A0ABY7CS90_9BASI|nr:uncharacterized protein PtA15_9A241 [Puccinia triticina]WAQ88116.1 hypothetical protein PtA15_9A241 [Puccinia triticina]
MGCASVVLVVESIKSLAKGPASADQRLHIPAIAADGQVRVLWKDHCNDLFINGQSSTPDHCTVFSSRSLNLILTTWKAFGIFTNAAGANIQWWIDPLGAMLISLALIILWSVSITQERWRLLKMF